MLQYKYVHGKRIQQTDIGKKRACIEGRLDTIQLPNYYSSINNIDNSVVKYRVCGSLTQLQ